MGSGLLAWVEARLRRYPRVLRSARGAKVRADSAFLALSRRMPRPLHPLHRQVHETAQSVVAGAPTSKKVLVFAAYQDAAPLAHHTALAFRLKAMGHQVEFVHCDRFQGNACNRAAPPGLDRLDCLRCSKQAVGFLAAAGFPASGLGTFAKPDDAELATRLTSALTAEECVAFTHRDYPLGRLVRVQIARYLRDSIVRKDDATTTIYRDFLSTAVRVVESFERALDHVRPDAVVLFSGNYLAESVALAVARRRHIEVTAWDGGYRTGSVIFTRNQPVGSLDAAGWGLWQNVPLTSAEERALDDLMAARRVGSGAVHKYYEPQDLTGEALVRSLGLEPRKPTAVLFTNIAYDTSIFGRDIVYPDYLSWLHGTIAIFRDRQDWQLIIRTHPAEKYFGVPVERRIASEIASAWPVLPPNVRCIRSDETIDSYALMDLAQVGLVANSTTAIEMALTGKPVITVADAQFRGLGMTVDPTTKEEYLADIERCLATLPSETVRTIARRYCYFAFYRLSVPLPVLANPASGDHVAFSAAGKRALREGDPDLDRVAASVLGDPHFVAGPAPGRA